MVRAEMHRSNARASLWLTLAQVFAEQIQLVQVAFVATTG